VQCVNVVSEAIQRIKILGSHRRMIYCRKENSSDFLGFRRVGHLMAFFGEREPYVSVCCAVTFWGLGPGRCSSGTSWPATSATCL
jgi:hypothetical protein